jgi:renalase
VPSGTGWHLHGGAVDLLASHVVITVPAPQVPGLLGDAHPLVAQISGVEMSPELTLMAAVSGDVSGDVPTVCETVQGDPLALIIQDSSKPNRPQHAGTAWVAHAGLAFSVAHLEKDLPDIAILMLPLLCARLGLTPDQVTHAVAHRWRHSRVAKPLGQAFVHTSDPTLYLGGDWCVGPTIEDAWSSGTAIATDLLAQNYR